MSPAPRDRFVGRLLTRQGGAVAAVLVLLIILGCLSVEHSSESKSVADGDGTYGQEGTIKLNPGEERDVYYPVPYVTPPYLELSDTAVCPLLAQQATYFHVRNNDPSPRTVEWKARGVKGKVVQTIAPSSSPAVPPLPPPVPVPVEPAAEQVEPPGKAR
jgi:hypothetical protein